MTGRALPRRARLLTISLGALLFALLCVSPAAAQEPETALASPAAGQEPVTADLASPFLPAAHWAIDAIRRLDALGMTDRGYDHGFRSVTQVQAARIFLDAALYSEVQAPGLARMVRGYRARFREEFAAASAAADGFMDGYGALTMSGFAGHERELGVVRPGEGYLDSGNWTDDANWTGPSSPADIRTNVIQLAGTRAFGHRLAIDVRGGRRGDEWTLDDAHVTARWRLVGAWVGRRSPTYGLGVGGTLILSGARAFDGGGIFLSEPIRLPWLLDHLGPIRFETFLSRTEENTPFRRPWFWAARLAASPHARLGLGVTRGAFFGGEGNAPITPRNIAYLLIGKHAGVGGEFEMQVVALDVRYRPPLGPVPLSLYAEWGFSDSAGAWRNVPASVVGVELPAVPRMPWLAVGLERTEFRPSCCGNPIWYRNWTFWGGWTDDGRPLGHPLGGHGTEWLVHAAADLFEANIRMGARAFLRDRGDENLYAPDRVGRSHGAAVSLRVRLGEMELVGEAEVDDGDAGWRASRLRGGVRLLL